ncbi:ExbD/TolR family protein [Tateyamaria sp. SN6-1]|uniref:ExbD/TolR family protein n=1 Tax=Tateyamaria sp. SN6-1 TaxID=3092148 RepID=UPI0039F5E008
MGARTEPLPERPRRYRFALTPLADAMFQLLIFFMLSTSLTPYSLVTLSTTADEAEETEAEAEPAGPEDENAEREAPEAVSDSGVTIWNIGNGTVASNGQVFDIEQLPSLAEAIGSQDDPGEVVLVVGEEARVQDVASALEALDSAEVEAVQIARTRGQ